MKKLLPLLAGSVLVFFSLASQAQLINPGFETWSADILVPSAMNPNTGNASTGWWDYNFFNSSYAGSSPISVTRCTDTVHSGNYSVRLESVVYTPASWNIYKSWGIPFIGHEYNDTLGILYNGYVDEMNIVFLPGFPFTQKISQFSFFYQYQPNGPDTAECRVALLNAGNVVAGGTFATSTATGSSGWQQAVITLDYWSNLTPDTMLVLFSAASLDTKPQPGSILWIDDVSVTLPSGTVQGLQGFSENTIFPNPSTGIFSIRQQKSAEKGTTVEVYTILGEKVLSASGKSSFDLSGYPKGMYFVKLNRAGSIHTEKIIVR